MSWLLDVAHIVAAVIGAWRLVDILLHDKIAEPIRNIGPAYLMQCPRCLSVWVGAISTIAFFFFPWLNWPFAISWLYLYKASKAQTPPTDWNLVVKLGLGDMALRIARQELELAKYRTENKGV